MSDIKLSLDGSDEDSKLSEIEKKDEIKIDKAINFSDSELKQIEDFSKKIDLTNSNVVLQYGSGAQKKISNFSEKTLDSIRNGELGEIGDLLDNVVSEIKSIDEEDNEGGMFGFFKKQKSKLESLKLKYQTSEKNIDAIAKSLNEHQITLLKDISMLDQMYALNEDYYKEISMYIEAGNRKLNKTYTEELPELEKKASESNLPLDAQKVNDLKAMANRFEKKLHDLDLTRLISIQMAPQIRMVQSSNSIMAEKIQTTIVNTIPLWKNQMVLALGVKHTENAIKAQEAVTNLTNDLLKSNADKLKQNTINTARSTERGIIDLDTIRHTNYSLISAIEEVRNIQIEGRENRAQAKNELKKLEDELKNNLMRRD